MPRSIGPYVASLAIATLLAASTTNTSQAVSATPSGSERTDAARTTTTSPDYVRRPGRTPLDTLRAQARQADRSGAPVMHHVYVSIVSVTPTGSDDTRTAADLPRERVEAAVARLSEYYLEESGGRIAFEVSGYEQRSWNERSCDRYRGLDLAEQLSFDGAALDPAWGAAHNHVLALTLEGGNVCGGALALLPGAVVFQNEGVEDISRDNPGLTVLLHEFGHNLGFGHADAGICRSATAVDAPLERWFDGVERPKTLCPYQEYGDWQDIMGFTRPFTRPHVSALQRYLAGWLDGSTADPTLGTTAITLQPLDDADGVRAVTVTDPRTGELYVVEYRTPSGADATSAEFTDVSRVNEAGKFFYFEPLRGSGGDSFARWIFDTPVETGGVRILRLLYRENDPIRHDPEFPLFQESLLLAVGTSTNRPNAYNRNGHLDVGESFRNYSGGIRVLARSLDPDSGAELTVTVSRAPSRTTSTAESTTLRPGQRLHLRTLVSSPRAAAVTGFLSLTVDGEPAGTVRLGDSGGSVSFVLPGWTARGRHAVEVAYSGSTSSRPSAAQPLSVRVR